MIAVGDVIHVPVTVHALVKIQFQSKRDLSKILAQSYDHRKLHTEVQHLKSKRNFYSLAAFMVLTRRNIPEGKYPSCLQATLALALFHP